MEDKLRLLREYFGYSSFREGQEPLVDAVLAGRDVFGIMPTGGGKSLCYQLPALMLPGVTLVVSPLISLMKDQVMSLDAIGVSAAFVNSSQPLEESRAVLRGLLQGAYKLLYVAPERLETESFVSAIGGTEVSLLAVDEAHCISQWGQDFRPSYLKIPAFLRRLPRRPILAAYTATATPQVREDVIRLLGLRGPVCVTTGFDRPNLRFDVLHPQNKLAALEELLGRFSGRSGIVYCATRKTVETLCDALRAGGFPATRYHAGLEPEERLANQEDFIYDRVPLMVATNAFGMGIDKSNVGFVIHYNMPKSMESYYQEAGRAGRDGAPADCVLLFSQSDVATARYFITHSNENPDLSDEERSALMARDFQRLSRMTDYCQTRQCLRSCILDYFGQAHPSRCGNCGNCQGEYVEVDITREAQMVLSCVQRIHTKLGYYVGGSTLVRCLAGSRDKRLLLLGLDQISTYGLMRRVRRERLRAVVSELVARRCLLPDPDTRALRPTPEARGVLFRGERVVLSVRRDDSPLLRTLQSAVTALRTPPPPAPDFQPGDREDRLLEALKLLRLKIAREEHVPLYVVFTNATLLEMTRLKPRTMEAFLDLPGVGTVKARRYGELFLAEISKYV